MARARSRPSAIGGEALRSPRARASARTRAARTSSGVERRRAAGRPCGRRRRWPAAPRPSGAWARFTPMPDRQPQPPVGARAGLHQDADGLAARAPARRWATSAAPRRRRGRSSARSAAASAATKESCAASAGGRSVTVSRVAARLPVSGRPGPAAPAAPGGLAAGGDPERAGLARLGAAARLGVGGVELVVGLDRRVVGQPSRPRPKAAAARAGQRVEPDQGDQHHREGEQRRRHGDGARLDRRRVGRAGGGVEPHHLDQAQVVEGRHHASRPGRAPPTGHRPASMRRLEHVELGPEAGERRQAQRREREARSWPARCPALLDQARHVARCVSIGRPSRDSAARQAKKPVTSIM